MSNLIAFVHNSVYCKQFTYSFKLQVTSPYSTIHGILSIFDFFLHHLLCLYISIYCICTQKFSTPCNSKNCQKNWHIVNHLSITYTNFLPSSTTQNSVIPLRTWKHYSFSASQPHKYVKYMSLAQLPCTTLAQLPQHHILGSHSNKWSCL